ncbi:MAG: hypothetical protein GXP50_04490, partial [Deltaproteobacteria bacterium]|nr:hypothetical protein [Deltaproteobacteria bacterium]
MRAPFDADRVLRLALRRGGELAEVYWEKARSATVVLEAGRVEEARAGVRHGAGIRVVEGGHEVYAHQTGPDPSTLEALAREVARLRPESEPAVVGSGAAAPVAGPQADPFSGLDLAARADLARRL